jgi:hypothetical protein
MPMLARLTAPFERLDRWLNAHVTRREPPWWVWPTLLVVIAVAALTVARIWGPGPGEQTLLWGHEWGAPCAFKVQTGHPCPQCGMTRSWVYAARLQVWRSFLYNPAGATLWWWMMFGGVLGAVRLITRNPRALLVPDRLMTGFALTWILVLYAGLWFLRVFADFNPLP